MRWPTRPRPGAPSRKPLAPLEARSAEANGGGSDLAGASRQRCAASQPCIGDWPGEPANIDDALSCGSGASAADGTRTRYDGSALACLRALPWAAGRGDKKRLFPTPRRQTGRLSDEPIGCVSRRSPPLSAYELSSRIPGRPVSPEDSGILRGLASARAAATG